MIDFDEGYVIDLISKTMLLASCLRAVPQSLGLEELRVFF